MKIRHRSNNGKFSKAQEIEKNHEMEEESLDNTIKSSLHLGLKKKKGPPVFYQVMFLFIAAIVLIPWMVVVGKSKKLREFQGVIEEVFSEAFTCKPCEICNCTNATTSSVKDNF